MKVLVVADSALAVSVWCQDLAAAGLTVVGIASWHSLVRDVHHHGPDVVVGWAQECGADLFQNTQKLEAVQPVAVLLFTQDVRVEHMAKALHCGVHAYVINGYEATRLRSLIQLSRVRFAFAQEQRRRIEDLSERLEERKFVDRAKGILMQIRHISEADAFGLLRQVSQRCNLRVGKVSQQVIAVVHEAQGINLAGRLRMLSQRIVKLLALRMETRLGEWDAAGYLTESVVQIEQILDRLPQHLSQPTYGDLINDLTHAWGPFKKIVQAPVEPQALTLVDQLAENFHQRANRLTQQLEHDSLAPSVYVVNLAGRQRMLSQRLAKQALLRSLAGGGEAAHDEITQIALQYEHAAAELAALPLRTPELDSLTQLATLAWQELLAGIAHINDGTGWGQERVGRASETLLAHLDKMTQLYAHHMQVLMG